MSILDTLLNRNSHPRLTEPGPDADQLQTILQAALRAPDHGRLRPWRFVVIAEDRRAVLGECFQHSLKLKGVTDDAQLKKALNAPLRAPLVLAGLLRALGFGCVWRTGGYATDPHIVEALGGDPTDQVIGFLYIGTRDGPSKLLSDEPLESLVSYF